MDKIKIIIFILFISSQLYSQSDSVITLEPMPTARYGITSVVYEEKIWIIGGKGRSDSTLNIVECYLPGTNSWEKNIPSLQIARTNAAAVVYNNKIYVIGGKNRSNKVLSSVEYFDPVERKWNHESDLISAREALTAVVLNDTLYAIGGGMTTVDTNHLSSVEYLDTNEKKWKLYPKWQLYQPRVSMATVVVENAVYTFGGSYFGPVDYVEQYQSNIGNELRSRMPVPRYSFAAVAVRDTVYIIGGSSNVNLIANIAYYDTRNDTWNALAYSLPVPRTELTAVNFGDNIYVFGGNNFLGLPVNIAEKIELTLALTNVTEIEHNLPADLLLMKNYPNPFNSSTIIPIHITQKSFGLVELIIYNINGRVIRSFQFNELVPGEQQVQWDGKNEFYQDVASGVYFYQLRIDQSVKATRKMMLLR